MPANYVLLEKISVGAAGASSVTFSGIPQTGYTDLVVKVSARDGASSVIDGVVVRFNNDTTSGNYTARRLIGSGSAASSDTNNVGAFAVGNTATANTFSNCEIYIPNYTSSTAKSVSIDNVAETNATTQYMGLSAFLYSGTAAITSIQISGESSSFLQYSTFYLYGVAKLGTTPAIVPYATGGDTIMTDGTYWYHAFRSSGTFTPAKGLSCDVLVVAGGGGGGCDIGGGGGAGGVLGFASQAISTAQTVTIGAGGASTSTAGNAGSPGSNTTFASLTAAVGGGQGAGYNVGQRTGGNGGSGGGGGVGSTSYLGGTGTSGQGNAGGYGNGNSSGGGGGYTAVGANGGFTTNTPGASGGAGGNSVTGLGSISTWLSATGTGSSGNIAGGGGSGTGGTTALGGVGGTGGGGNGAQAVSGAPGNNATAGVANTGSGGGGGGNYGGTGGAGGSGLVIVRYAV
jgi:hypothetical protein